MLSAENLVRSQSNLENCIVPFTLAQPLLRLCLDIRVRMLTASGFQ